jgi:putative (di)nucleoside polyphosphate hydrolase
MSSFPITFQWDGSCKFAPLRVHPRFNAQQGVQGLPSTPPPVTPYGLPGSVPLSREDLPYRICVGMMLLNAGGQVWMGRRKPKWLTDARASAWQLPTEGTWQMPQGGIGPRELVEDAAMRELEEETAVRRARIIGEIPHRLTYDLPDDLLGVALKGRYRGQHQFWFAMRFEGSDDEINITERNGLKAEFDAWRWADMADVPRQIAPFKREIYHSVVNAFAHLA